MQQQSTTSTPVVCPRGTSAYTWQEGDTLESVARDRGITAQSMTLANPDTDFNTLAAGSTVCIPPAIGGLPVLYIGAECFAGCEAETVILPDTALSVEIDAFRGSSLRELYLFDNIESISDHCFRDCPNLQTLHINAVEAPKWTDFDRHSALADKYDILIEHEHSPKIVVFGGSGPYFSIDTRQMTDALAQEGYLVLNMAINAHFNAYMQFAMIEPYMRAGDILIHHSVNGLHLTDNFSKSAMEVVCVHTLLHNAVSFGKT